MECYVMSVKGITTIKSKGLRYSTVTRNFDKGFKPKKAQCYHCAFLGL